MSITDATIRNTKPAAKPFKLYVVDGVCVLCYDNERGKGDHRHIGQTEQTVIFSGMGNLISDFLADVRRWNNEPEFLSYPLSAMDDAYPMLPEGTRFR